MGATAILSFRGKFMPRTRLFVCLAVGFVAFHLEPREAGAATIAIAPGDADGLGNALGRAVAGDVIELAAGTYRPTRPLWVGQQGRADAPIVVRGANGARPIIDGGLMPNDAAVIGIGGQYVTIEGLELQAAKQQCISVWGGAHVRILGNVIHDCHQGGIFVGFGRRGVATDVHIEGNRVFHTSLGNKARAASGGWSGAIAAQRAGKVTVKNNTVYENYGEGILFNLVNDSIASGNVVHDNFSVELYLDNATGCRFVDNLVRNTGNTDFFHNRGGWRPAAGIQMANESYSDSLPLNDNRIEGNVVIGAGWGLYYGAYQNGGGMKNTVVAHNTFYGAAVTLLHLDADAGHNNTVFANNLFVQTNGGGMTRIEGGTGGLRFVSNGWQGGAAGAAGGANDVSGDPKFRNAGGQTARDYDLAASSPYLGAATALTGVASRSFIGARGAIDAGTPAPAEPTPTPAPGSPSAPMMPPGAPPVDSAPVSPEAPEANQLPGLQGTYFSDETLTVSALSRVDDTVDFSWGSGSPGAALPADGFSVRWTGALTPSTTGKYKVGTTSDDGVRLWVDGARVIDHWNLHAAEDDVVELELVAGKAYDIRLEMYEHGGQATAKFWWVPPAQMRQIVPSAHLSHAKAASSVLTWDAPESQGSRELASGDAVRGTVGCTFASGAAGSNCPVFALGLGAWALFLLMRPRRASGSLTLSRCQAAARSPRDQRS